MCDGTVVGICSARDTPRPKKK